MAQYLIHINSNPHFSLRLVSPLLKLALQRQKYIEIQNAFAIGDISYTIGFDPQRWTLAIRWSEDGEQRKQRVGVVAEPSNLPSLSGSYVYYFICPQTGTKCRILYKMEGGGFSGRKALTKALYALQLDSHKFRYVNYPPEGKEPFKRYGKQYYRGKLTPYGKKCKRYAAAVKRQDEAFMQSLTDTDLFDFVKRSYSKIHSDGFRA